MQTPLFCLPSKQTACHPDNSDNFLLIENLLHTVSSYLYIYVNLTLAPPNINPIFVSSSKSGGANAKPEE